MASRVAVLVAGLATFLGHLYCVNRAALGRGSEPLWFTAPLAIGLVSLATYLWFGEAARQDRQ